MKLIWLALMTSSLVACKASSPDDDKMNPDAGTGEMLMPPRVMAPSETPLTTVAMRGVADGASRVVIKNAGDDTAKVSPLLPGGDFCVEVNLPADMASSFNVYAVAEDGNISQPAEVEVVHDNAAPPPANPSCSNSGACDESETCGNDVDDDCNGFKDDCDSACNGCTDDYLEPNDTPFSVPMVAEDTYSDLKICPCREDWFAFLVGEGETINVSATFDHNLIDIDLKLYTADTAEMHIDDPVAESTTTANTESINYTTTASGAYYLRVYSFRMDGQGSYTLTVR